MEKLRKCTKCLIEYPETKDFFYSRAKIKFRSCCKKCTNKENENWAKLNPEKIKIISKKSNLKQKELLKTSSRHILAKKESYRKYKESGRRHLMNSKPEQIEKPRIRSRKRYHNPKNKESIKQYSKKYREDKRDYLNALHIDRRLNLKDSYIASSMRISVKNLTPEIIETKRNIIKLKRFLKNGN